MNSENQTKKRGHEQTQLTGSVVRVGGDRPGHDKSHTVRPSSSTRGNETAHAKKAIVPPRLKSSSIQTTLHSFLPRRNGGQKADGIRPQPADALGQHRFQPSVNTETRVPDSQKTRSLQLSGTGTSPNPSQPKRISALRVLQLNICGLIPKTMELSKLLHERAIDVVLLQETLVGKKRSANLSGYTAYTCKCADCRGVMSFVRNGMKVKQTPGPRAQD